MKGLVLRSVGSSYDILGEDATRYKGRLKGKFKIEDKKLTNPIAVGDTVIFTLENKATNDVMIEQIGTRTNYIIRKSVHKSEHSHLIACNIDEAFLVVTLAAPETSTGFIDRFLAAAESFRIPVSIVFNKSDLYDENLLKYKEDLSKLYEGIGYKTFLVSAEKAEGIAQLKTAASGKKVLFSGHSGVGKSTLMNKIFPGLNQKTLEISGFSQKGVHSTTFAEMFDMGNNTFLIDTPGIKEFGLMEIEKEELKYYFPEMRELIGSCKYHNCLHRNEPSCAIRQAVENNMIAASRYKNYLSMLENEDNRR